MIVFDEQQDMSDTELHTPRLQLGTKKMPFPI
jgi:hypothetical protein